MYCLYWVVLDRFSCSLLRAVLSLLSVLGLSRVLGNGPTLLLGVLSYRGSFR